MFVWIATDATRPRDDDRGDWSSSRGGRRSTRQSTRSRHALLRIYRSLSDYRGAAPPYDHRWDLTDIKSDQRSRRGSEKDGASRTCAWIATPLRDSRW